MYQPQIPHVVMEAIANLSVFAESAGASSQVLSLRKNLRKRGPIQELTVIESGIWGKVWQVMVGRHPMMAAIDRKPGELARMGNTWYPTDLHFDWSLQAGLPIKLRSWLDRMNGGYSLYFQALFMPLAVGLDPQDMTEWLSEMYQQTILVQGDDVNGDPDKRFIVMKHGRDFMAEEYLFLNAIVDELGRVGLKHKIQLRTKDRTKAKDKPLKTTKNSPVTLQPSLTGV